MEAYKPTIPRIPIFNKDEIARGHHLTQVQKYRNHFCAGAIALSSSFAAMHFLDTYKIIIQNTAGKSTSLKLNLFSINTLKHLSRGFLVSVIGAGPQGGLRLATYEWTKSHILHNPSKKQQGSWIPTFGPIVASALAAISGDTVSSIVKVPREVITTRLQTEAIGSASGTKPSFTRAVASIYKQEGVMGFFRGFSSTTLRDWPFMIILFTSYESFKKVHEQIMSNGSSDEDEEIAITTLKSTLFGGISGKFVCALAGYLTTPFDVVKTKIMTASPIKTSRRTIRSVTRELYENQKAVLEAAGTAPRGLKLYKAFWTGAVPRSTWWFCVCSIFFPVYESMKETFRDMSI
ncbi:hypothetical protein SmJEL517_g00293 [Synchytrium microbalum]|uniref:Mitochondrial carrier protein n=1 Tax=Synchytrium microbalum TaxID=1806994 RepID=A0A507CJP6_9FUNG|nr:uncharacterized protein SmJEL517_g00293 [Synchytrium microbalum]TPX38055.1 hypothetical protein SmJEL517_g00293 [Synchytrium microbalum]